MADPLRINAVELLRQPGAVRTITVDVDPGSIEAQHERLTGDLHVDLRLEALNDGITVIGTVSAPWATECRRCLVAVSGVAVVPVDELYQVQPLAEEAYLIEDGQLDLVPLVRETALIELDLERLCRDDCAGLCPVCGIDRNDASCDCDTSISDDRWAALEGFVPDDD
ncbi:MAG TPA: DUF177 domain-containing protein [Ilumatobacteraceae bacterium]|nr:DUF177 domain-containing protein [Ilumatobacteraceae bacterium]